MSLRSRRAFDSSMNPIEQYRAPPPSHRHAAPSAPWPWVNLGDKIDARQLRSEAPPVPEPCDHSSCGGECWIKYPQSRFPNWTPDQVVRSAIGGIVAGKHTDCVIYPVDVDEQGVFAAGDMMTITEKNKMQMWDKMVKTKPQKGVRVRALFVENMSGPALQMLGAKYNIEPFFFSSSLNWIPSRYQEEVQDEKGDHITITLTFLRSMAYPSRANRLNTLIPSGESSSTSSLAAQMIDTQAPLVLRSGQGPGSINRMLVLDILAVHLVRNVHGSTIVSFHAENGSESTTAHYLHERIRFAGQSVYWQSIFQESPDPTFVLLTFVWHAMYAWDEALENLYTHICNLETRVISTSDMDLTRELHVIRAHHLHYSSLLEDFRKTVEFIRDTKNPAMDSPGIDKREWSHSLMERECNNLLNEIRRLEMGRRMQDKRLKNVMNLVFSSVNIGDSKRMQAMTEAAVRDSAAYLTMIFLPASFVAAVFGMNVREIAPGTNGSLSHYVEFAIPLTFITIWVIVAFQSRYLLTNPDVSFWRRLGWPYIILKDILARKDLEQADSQRPNRVVSVNMMNPKAKNSGSVMSMEMA